MSKQIRKLLWPASHDQNKGRDNNCFNCRKGGFRAYETQILIDEFESNAKKNLEFVPSMNLKSLSKIRVFFLLSFELYWSLF